MVCERPVEINRNDRGVLHSLQKLAIAWADGWGVGSVNGVRVPAEWVLHPEKLDPVTALNWPNAEQRRAAAEIIGWRRVLEAVKAKVIDEDSDPMIGRLLEADLPDSPGSRFLDVKCGTGRSFCIPVPREMKTALQANAWTYDVDNLEWFRNREVRT